MRPELIRRWIHERQADDGQAFRGNGKRTPEQEEIKRLKTKMKRLEIEKEILKKSGNYSAHSVMADQIRSHASS
ncbi:MAG: hypothetical protein KZQ61_03620 [Candidatus Thiodiazotropha sp. (ex Lucinoma aequizonata)]|nr:hypothetical protein [Candidatus Thiodiazotropha sp. (ex Lucinoma aequizonata)]